MIVKVLGKDLTSKRISPKLWRPHMLQGCFARSCWMFRYFKVFDLSFFTVPAMKLLMVCRGCLLTQFLFSVMIPLHFGHVQEMWLLLPTLSSVVTHLSLRSTTVSSANFYSAFFSSFFVLFFTLPPYSVLSAKRNLKTPSQFWIW